MSASSSDASIAKAGSPSLASSAGGALAARVAVAAKALPSYQGTDTRGICRSPSEESRGASTSVVIAVSPSSRTTTRAGSRGALARCGWSALPSAMRQARPGVDHGRGCRPRSHSRTRDSFALRRHCSSLPNTIARIAKHSQAVAGQPFDCSVSSNAVGQRRPLPCSQRRARARAARRRSPARAPRDDALRSGALARGLEEQRLAILQTLLAHGFVADSGEGMGRRYRLGMTLRGSATWSSRRSPCAMWRCRCCDADERDGPHLPGRGVRRAVRGRDRERRRGEQRDPVRLEPVQARADAQLGGRQVHARDLSTRSTSARCLQRPASRQDRAHDHGGRRDAARSRLGGPAGLRTRRRGGRRRRLLRRLRRARPHGTHVPAPISVTGRPRSTGRTRRLHQLGSATSEHARRVSRLLGASPEAIPMRRALVVEQPGQIALVERADLRRGPGES